LEAPNEDVGTLNEGFELWETNHSVSILGLLALEFLLHFMHIFPIYFPMSFWLQVVG
jgi:hypothetical protein